MDLCECIDNLSVRETLSEIEQCPQEQIFSIILQLSVDDILNFCKSSPILWRRVYHDNYLWKLLSTMDYPGSHIIVCEYPQLKDSWRIIYYDLSQDIKLKSLEESLGIYLIKHLNKPRHEREHKILRHIDYLYDSKFIRAIDSRDEPSLRELLFYRTLVYIKYKYIIETPISKYPHSSRKYYYKDDNSKYLKFMKYEDVLKELVIDGSLNMLISLIVRYRNFDIIAGSNLDRNYRINMDWYLVIAAREGHQNVVDFLLYPSKYIPNTSLVPAIRYKWALNAAARAGHVEIVKSVLSTISEIKDSERKTGLINHKQIIEIAKKFNNEEITQSIEQLY